MTVADERQVDERHGGGSETERAAARIGTVVDKYAIIRVLGQGGMGAVYEARHLKLDRRFAVKFLLPRHAENQDVLRRFENEAKAAGGLEHPNLAAVTDFGRADDGSPYIVMEFLQGQDCAQLLRGLGPLSASRATNIVAQACRGLATAHKVGIVHRDLKPENLFVTDAGDGSDLIKVLDFGIAKLRTVDATVVTGTGEMFGTAHYMSPEQARGAGDVDERTDVWSLGVVLFELLSGRKPFQGQQFLDLVYQIQTFDPPSLSSLRADLAPGLVRIVEQAMSKDISRRIPNARALAEALLPFVGRDGGSQGHRSADALALTLATPPTQVAAVGAARQVALQAGDVEALTTARRSRNKWYLVGAVIVLALVVAGIVVGDRRRAASSLVTSSPPAKVDVDSPRGAAETAPNPVTPTPTPPPTPTQNVTSTQAATAVTPPAPRAADTPQPAAPPDRLSASSANGVRTPFERSDNSSNKRALTRPTQSKLGSATGNPPTPAANPAPPLPVSPTGRPIYIDKDDPFGP